MFNNIITPEQENKVSKALMKKNIKPYHVIFEVKVINGNLLPGATLKIGDRFVGEYFPVTNSIFFEDVNNQEWWFKPYLDCTVIGSI